MAYAFSTIVVQDFDGVAVYNRDNSAGEIGTKSKSDRDDR